MVSTGPPAATAGTATKAAAAAAAAGAGSTAVAADGEMAAAEGSVAMAAEVAAGRKAVGRDAWRRMARARAYFLRGRVDGTDGYDHRFAPFEGVGDVAQTLR